MRLLAFCDYYSLDSCGGAERVAREVYTRLASDHGVDVIVVGTGPRRPADEPAERVGRGGIREVFVPGRDLSPLLGAQLTVSTGLGRVVRHLAAKFRPTVLHANSLHFHGTLTAARLARRSGIPLVTTAHLGAVSLLPVRMRVGAQAWDQVCGRSIIKASRHVVAVSDSVAEHVQELGATRDEISVAYNGVDHATFHAEGRRPRSGPLRVGFIGRLIANKGPQVLVDAAIAAAASGTRLDVVLVGDGPMRTHLQARVHAAGADDMIKFVGQVDDVACRLRGFDVVVRPSYTEGLPLGVIEAMATGAVVICSDVPGNLELVQDGATGLVFAAGDQHALTALLNRAATRPELLDGLRDKALARAAELSWDACAQQHLNALQHVSTLRRST